MLFNMGDAEISVGELTMRGYYLGSNVSYNVKKLSESGYLVAERSMHDRRSIRVRLTPEGRTLRDRLSTMLDRHTPVTPPRSRARARVTRVTCRGSPTLVVTCRDLQQGAR